MQINRRRRRIALEDIAVDASESFAVREFKPNAFPFVWHHHPEIELVVVFRGRGRRYVGDSVEEFSDGDCCLLGGDLPHTWHSDANARGAHSMVIQFLPGCLGDGLFASPELRPIAALLRRADRGLRLDGALRDEVSARMRRMLAHPSGSWRNVTALLEILGLIAESRDYAPLAMASYRPLGDNEADRKLNTVLQLMQRGPDGIPGQAAAARALRMSPSAFSRFFHRALGKTYAEYANRLRVAAACRALLETDTPITEIAFAAGFNNLSNFNRRFRRMKGTSPGDYRAACRVAAGDEREAR